jgi:hypothetical protein
VTLPAPVTAVCETFLADTAAYAAYVVARGTT